MSDVLIVKNISREGPGLIATVLTGRGISYTIVDLNAGELFPSPEGYKAIIVLGGPDSANDETDKMNAELGHISETLDAGLPYLGVCLGLQTLVKAAGGAIVKSPVKEVGFIHPDGTPFTVNLTDTGKQDPLFSGLSDSFNVFQLHGEAVEITPDMTLLATGAHCRNQIVRVGTNAYGIQCHFEVTPEMFEVWISEDTDLLVFDKEELRAQFVAIQDEYTRVGNKLINNFLGIAGL